MKILVTGGAGYIGSFMTKSLLEKGEDVTVFDSLERGHKEVIDNKAKFIEGNVLSKEDLVRLFSEKFDAIIHFAGLISMEESVKDPYIYFKTNTFGSLNLIEEALKNGVNKIIFSSTAGVYGNPIKLPISEDHQKIPTNPYGESKLSVERILHWYRQTKGLNFVSLRYFNAAGASLDGNLGENHSPETHIIPNAIKAAINKEEFILYGNDYNTKDGTCVRDYIHVLDLVEAHVLALLKLKDNDGEFFYNVGTGNGFTNKEVLEEIEKIGGKKIKIHKSERRPGDADILIADPTNIKKDLSFNPKYSDLNTIVKTAWEWHKKNSK